MICIALRSFHALTFQTISCYISRFGYNTVSYVIATWPRIKYMAIY